MDEQDLNQTAIPGAGPPGTTRCGRIADLRDAIALVRRHLLLASGDLSLPAGNPDAQQIPVAPYHRMVDSLACVT